MKSWNNNTCEKKNLVLIGKISGLHGIKGNLKVYSYAESNEIFKPGNSLIVYDSIRDFEKKYAIEWARPQNKFVLISFKGITSRTMAVPLAGLSLYVEKKSLAEPDDGTYYWFDIIGLSVYTKTDEYIGKVDSIIQTGANDVYVVKVDINNKSEVLIPAVKTVVLDIDLKKKMMVVDLPEGL